MESDTNSNKYFYRYFAWDDPSLVLPVARGIKNEEDNDNDDNEVLKTKYQLQIGQQYSSDESGVVWDASLMLAKFLETDIIRMVRTQAYRGVNVLELGAGTGIVSLWLASMGATVCITDLPETLPLIEHNVQLNTHLLYDVVQQITIRSFDWFNTEQWNRNTSDEMFLQWKPLCDIDLLIISDCLYYEKGCQVLIQFIEWFLLNKELPNKTLDKPSQHRHRQWQQPRQVLIAYEDRFDKVDMVENFFITCRNNPNLAVESISSDQLHPEYTSTDLHISRIVAV